MPKALDEEEKFDVSIDMDEGFYGTTAGGHLKKPKETSPRPLITWKNRRRMAWLSIITCLLLGTYLMTLAPVEKLEHLANIYYYYCLFCGMVVASYMGFTSLPLMGWGKGGY